MMPEGIIVPDRVDDAEIIAPDNRAFPNVQPRFGCAQLVSHIFAGQGQTPALRHTYPRDLLEPSQPCLVKERARELGVNRRYSEKSIRAVGAFYSALAHVFLALGAQRPVAGELDPAARHLFVKHRIIVNNQALVLDRLAPLVPIFRALVLVNRVERVVVVVDSNDRPTHFMEPGDNRDPHPARVP